MLGFIRSRVYFASAIIALLLCTTFSFAQDHIVTSADMAASAQQKSATRQADIDAVMNLLEKPDAVRAMDSMHANASQIKRAVPTLSDDELATLAQRARQADVQDVQAAGVSTITFIIAIIVIAIIVGIIAS